MCYWACYKLATRTTEFVGLRECIMRAGRSSMAGLCLQADSANSAPAPRARIQSGIWPRRAAPPVFVSAPCTGLTRGTHGCRWQWLLLGACHWESDGRTHLLCHVAVKSVAVWGVCCPSGWDLTDLSVQSVCLYNWWDTYGSQSTLPLVLLIIQWLLSFQEVIREARSSLDVA